MWFPCPTLQVNNWQNWLHRLMETSSKAVDSSWDGQITSIYLTPKIRCAISQSFHEYIFLVSAKDVMEHFAFPGNIDFAADDQGAFHVLFMKGCCVYSSSVKQCLPSVNHGQFPIQITQNCKHSKCLQILAEEDFPLKLLWRTPIKIHRRADRRRQPRSREHRFSTAKVYLPTLTP